MMKKLVFITGIVLYSLISFGQELHSYEEMKKKYPDRLAVVIEDKQFVNIDVKGKNIVVSYDIYKETLHLQDNSTQVAQDKVYSTHYHKLKNIAARTIVPTDNKIKTFKVVDFMRKREQTENIFYDDVFSTNFVYPAIQPGARTILEYTSEITDPHVLNAFYFDSYAPSIHQEFTIKADKRIKFHFQVFNKDTLKIVESNVTKGNYTTYTWRLDNYGGTQYEPETPSFRYLVPHLVYYIEKVDLGKETIPVFSSLSDLTKWHYSFAKDINQNPSDALKAKVSKIVEGATTEEEKVRRLYYWVQDNIRYIAFEDGLQGFIPSEASDVFDKGYGDCKGMSSLLQTMLKIAGVKAYLTWIGTDDLPYKYTEIASPIVDNHMIVTWYWNNKPVFLDATSQYNKFGMPSMGIQGKEALIPYNENEFKVENVPVIAKEENASIDSTFFTIQNKTLTGTGAIYLNNYPKSYYTYMLSGLDDKQTKDRVQDILELGNNKCFIDHFSIKNLNDKDEPLSISYKFKIEDYFKEIDDEVYLNLNLHREYQNRTIDIKKRKYPYSRGYMNLDTDITIFQVPEGYSIKYLPSNSTAAFEKFGYKISYTVEGNKVIQKKEIFANYQLLTKEDFQKWNDVISPLNKAYREVLIIQKNKK